MHFHNNKSTTEAINFLLYNSGHAIHDGKIPRCLPNFVFSSRESGPKCSWNYKFDEIVLRELIASLYIDHSLLKDVNLE